MNKELVTEVLIGSDPEMFLYSESLFKYIPVCGLVGGTKEEPLPITDISINSFIFSFYFIFESIKYPKSSY